MHRSWWMLAVAWAASACGAAAPSPSEPAAADAVPAQVELASCADGPRVALEYVWRHEELGPHVRARALPGYGEPLLEGDPDEPPSLDWTGDLNGDGFADAIVRFGQCGNWGDCVFGAFAGCRDARIFVTVFPPDYGQGLRAGDPDPRTGWRTLHLGQRTGDMEDDRWYDDPYRFDGRRYVRAPDPSPSASLESGQRREREVEEEEQEEEEQGEEEQEEEEEAGETEPLVMTGTLRPAGDSRAFVPEDGESGYVRGFAVSPDGRYAALAGEQTLLFDLRAGRATATFDFSGWNAAFSPDGRTLLLGDEAGRVHVVDVAGGRERWVIDAHRDRLGGLAYRPDGASFVSVGIFDGRAVLWDGASRTPRAEITLDGQLTSAALARDGSRVAIGTRERVYVWAFRGEPVRVDDASEPALALSADGGELLSGSDYVALHLLDSSEPRLVARVSAISDSFDHDYHAPRRLFVGCDASRCSVVRLALPSRAAIESVRAGGEAVDSLGTVARRREIGGVSVGTRDYITAVAFGPEAASLFVVTRDGWLARYEVPGDRP